MANTYTQLHIHFVFAVKFRRALIEKSWREGLHKYITGIFQNNGHKMIQINSVADHIHILAGMRPHQSISDIIKNVKAESSKWIKHNNFNSRFLWQEGYGAFAVSKKGVDKVIRYIQNQEAHHKKISFREEYVASLKENEIEFNRDYIFQDPV